MEAKEQELGELRQEAASPELWSNPDHAREVTRRLARYEKLFERVAGLDQSLEDAEVLLELAGEEEDESARADVISELSSVEADLAEIDVRRHEDPAGEHLAKRGHQLLRTGVLQHVAAGSPV